MEYGFHATPSKRPWLGQADSLLWVGPLLACVVSLLVLLGWALDLDTLKRVLPGLVAMNPVTASCLLLAATAFLCSRRSSKVVGLLGKACAAAVIAVGLIKLTELTLQASPGIDALLFADKLHDAHTGAPNRMAPNTALNFVLLGSAILLMRNDTPRAIALSQLLALGAVASSALALLGYLYGVRAFYGIGAYIPMAVHTATVFIVLAVTVLAAHTRTGLLSILSREGLAGTTARRLILAAIVVPVVIGWLRLMGEKAGLYSTELGVAMSTIANMIVFASAVLWVARTLHQTDTARHLSQAALLRERSLVGLFKSVAEASNQSSFERALQDTLAAVVDHTSAPWGVCFRTEPKGSKVPDLMWWPRTPQLDQASFISTLRRQLSSATGPVQVRVDIAVEGGPVKGMLIPISDGTRVNATLFIAGMAEIETANYILEQLSRSGERDRIATSLNDSIARHEALFVSATDGIVTINESGSVESINPAALAMFGVKEEEMGRRHIERFIGGLSLSNLSRPSEANQEAIVSRKDGSTFPVEAAVSLMNLESRKVFVAFIRDISERKRVERLQTEFISTVSHELRTPLTSIGGSLGLIAGGAAGVINDQAARLVEIAYSNSQRLVRLVNDILDIQKLQAGRMSFNFTKVELDQLVDATIAANRGFALAHGTRIDTIGGGAGAFLRADVDRLNQAITNVISNAVKFSPQGGVVTVHTALTTGAVRICVQDQGPGIPVEFRHRIFERFAQADSSDTRRVGGSGLGLSITREIVQQHGGSISFDTELGKGTTFYLDLPLFRDGVIEPGEPRGQQVLICARDKAVVSTACAALEADGFQCVVAANLEEVERVGLTTLAVVVIDLNLSEDNVFEWLRDLQAKSARPIPVVLMTFEGNPDRTQAYGLPLARWVVSPDEMTRLPEIVRGLVEQSEKFLMRVLHVEDDPDVIEVVRQSLQTEFAIDAAPSLEAAQMLLSRNSYHFVILDLTLSDGRGTDLIPDLIDKAGDQIPIIVFTAEDSTPELARRVEAVLTKSRENLTTLVEAVRAAVAKPSGASDKDKAEVA